MEYQDYMKCHRCNREIPDNESYMLGFMIPPANEVGERKFGCSPNIYFCERCVRKMPQFFGI
jgi:hypothetical protein